MEQLFSNLEAQGNVFRHHPGSMVQSISLIAGTTVGAGILALPAATLPTGVVPSTLVLVGAWVYMVASGLLIAEVNLNAIRRLGRPSLGLLSLAEHTLGTAGARVAGLLYVFLHYALLVAYIARGGEILASALENFPGLPVDWLLSLGAVLFATLFGGLIYFGSERFVGQLNSIFVAIAIAAFGGLLVVVALEVEPSQLWFQDWRTASAAIPAIFVALVYHNVIPVITQRLEGNARKVRQAITLGSAIPLVMFLAWNAAILGSTAPEVWQQASAMTFDPLEQLRHSHTNQWLGAAVSLFSEFAIATSFVGFTYGLLNFFGDALRISYRDRSHQRWWLFLLVLVPPACFSLLNPGIFLKAIDYAGAFGISLLFGIIPAMMAWKQRYHHPPRLSGIPNQQLVPGGKATLVAVMGIAAAIVSGQVLLKVGLS